MKKLILLLSVMVPVNVSAQSADAYGVQAEKYAFVTLEKYCAGVENFSKARQPRVFANISSSSASSWVEFSSTTEWMHEGSPHPRALVWYKDGHVIRVEMTAKGGGGEKEYADYCYRPNGSLARLRPVPGTQVACDRSLLHCRVTFREGRLYPPKGLPADHRFVGVRTDEDILLGPLQSESTSFVVAPMDWPEYLTVSELPFSPLL
jgi:hypothetical protein